MLSKISVFFIFISVLLLSSQTLARKCSRPVDFIIKCVNGNCEEGFFAYRVYCKSQLYNVTENQKTYKFNQKYLAQVNIDSKKLNGFYAIHFDDLRYFTDEKNEEIESRDVELSAGGLIFLRPNSELIKLDFKNELSIKDVQREYAKKSTTESLKSTTLNILPALPMLFFIILIHTRWRKKATKIRTGLFVITVLGIILLPAFENLRFLFAPTITSAFYLILWSFFYLTTGVWKAFRQKENS